MRQILSGLIITFNTHRNDQKEGGERDDIRETWQKREEKTMEMRSENEERI